MLLNRLILNNIKVFLLILNISCYIKSSNIKYQQIKKLIKTKHRFRFDCLLNKLKIDNNTEFSLNKNNQIIIHEQKNNKTVKTSKKNFELYFQSKLIKKRKVHKNKFSQLANCIFKILNNKITSVNTKKNQIQAFKKKAPKKVKNLINDFCFKIEDNPSNEKIIKYLDQFSDNLKNLSNSGQKQINYNFEIFKVLYNPQTSLTTKIKMLKKYQNQSVDIACCLSDIFKTLDKLKNTQNKNELINLIANIKNSEEEPHVHIVYKNKKDIFKKFLANNVNLMIANTAHKTIIDVIFENSTKDIFEILLKLFKNKEKINSKNHQMINRNVEQQDLRETKIRIEQSEKEIIKRENILVKYHHLNDEFLNKSQEKKRKHFVYLILNSEMSKDQSIKNIKQIRDLLYYTTAYLDAISFCLFQKMKLVKIDVNNEIYLLIKDKFTKQNLIDAIEIIITDIKNELNSINLVYKDILNHANLKNADNKFYMIFRNTANINLIYNNIIDMIYLKIPDNLIESTQESFQISVLFMNFLVLKEFELQKSQNQYKYHLELIKIYLNFMHYYKKNNNGKFFMKCCDQCYKYIHQLLLLLNNDQKKNKSYLKQIFYFKIAYHDLCDRLFLICKSLLDPKIQINNKSEDYDFYCNLTITYSRKYITYQKKILSIEKKALENKFFLCDEITEDQKNYICNCINLTDILRDYFKFSYINNLNSENIFVLEFCLRNWDLFLI